MIEVDERLVRVSSGHRHTRLVVTGVESMPRAVQRLRRRVLPKQFAAGDAAMARHGSWLVVCWSGRKVLGYAWAVMHDRSTAYVEEVAVDSSRQSQGIGAELVENLTAWLDVQGFTRITICSLHDRHKQRREAWFQRLGFRQGRYGFSASPEEIGATQGEESPVIRCARCKQQRGLEGVCPSCGSGDRDIVAVDQGAGVEEVQVIKHSQLLEALASPGFAGELAVELNPVWLLGCVLDELKERLERSDRYDLLRVGGLLRQLLLDGTPLVHAANRQARAGKIWFTITDVAPTPELQPNHLRYLWAAELDPVLHPDLPSTRLSMDAFLARPVMHSDGQQITVRDAILQTANVAGGVHLGSPQTDQAAKSAAMTAWDHQLRINDNQPVTGLLLGIGWVVWRAAQPIVSGPNAT